MSPGGFPRLPSVQSDQRLLALARDGDEHAFGTVVRRHRRSLLRYCRRMGLSDSRAEDVVQQSLLRAWLALERGAEVHAPKAWLYRTVHNTAVNVLRSAREHAPLEDGAVVEAAASAESEFERRVAVRQTLGEVSTLPQMQREAILLTAFDGRSHEEIALQLGVTHGAVRGLLYRARATLRDAAAAVLPQPLLLWASGVLGRMAPGAAKVAELSAPAPNADIGGALAKGAALAATAAVLAVGTGVVPLPRHLAHRSKAAAQALGIAPATADAQATSSLASAAPPWQPLGGLRDPLRSARSRAAAPSTTPAVGRARPVGARRPHDGSGDRSSSGSGDLAFTRGGEADRSGGGDRASGSGGSDSAAAPKGASTDSSPDGRPGAECDHCSPVSGGHDESSHPSGVEPSASVLAGEATVPSATPKSEAPEIPAGSVEPPPEQHTRD